MCIHTFKEIYYTMGDVQNEGAVDFTTYHEEYGGHLDVTMSNDIIDELINLVYERFFEFAIYKKTFDFFDDSTSLSSSDIRIICKRIDNIISMTYERYYPMLKAYRDNTSDPIPQLKSSSSGKTRFNDTPQDDDLTDGYFADDDHATNVTASVSETSVDSGSLVDRLDSLYKNWRDVMRDWTSEFKGLFMEV